MYDHIFYKQVQISRSDIRPHIKWAVSLVILHMVTSIFLQGLCGYIWLCLVLNLRLKINLVVLDLHIYDLIVIYKSIMDNVMYTITIFAIIKMALTVLECIVGLLLNVTYIVVFILRPQLRNQSNYLNLGLAASGIKIAVGYSLHAFMTLFVVETGKYLFKFASFMIYHGILWQCLILAGCAIDRCYSILKPLHYETIITKMKIMIYIIMSCTLTALFSLSSILYPLEPNFNNITLNTPVNENINTGYIVFGGIWVLSLFIISIISISIYSGILCVLRKQMRRIQPHCDTLQRSRSMYKGIMKLTFIMIYFTLMRGMMIGTTFALITGMLTVQQLFSASYVVFMDIYGLFNITSCFVNIIFYGLANKQFTNELKSVLYK